jgi:hypothetical protein
MAKLRITLDVDAHELDRLAGLAYGYGWSREEPRKSWTDKERKEAARYAIEALVSERVHGNNTQPRSISDGATQQRQEAERQVSASNPPANFTSLFSH